MLDRFLAWVAQLPELAVYFVLMALSALENVIRRFTDIAEYRVVGLQLLVGRLLDCFYVYTIMP